MPRKKPIVQMPPPGSLPEAEIPEAVHAPPPQRRQRAPRKMTDAQQVAALTARAARTGTLACRITVSLSVEDYAALVLLAEEYGEAVTVVSRAVFRRGLRAAQFTPAPQQGQRPFYDGLPRQQQIPLGTEWPPTPPQTGFQRPQVAPPAFTPPQPRIVMSEETEAVYGNAQLNPAMLPQGYTAPSDRPAPPPPPMEPPPGTVDALPPEPRLFVD